MTEYERERRLLINRAEHKLLEAIDPDLLTYDEWIYVLQKVQTTMIAWALEEEWKSEAAK